MAWSSGMAAHAAISSPKGCAFYLRDDHVRQGNGGLPAFYLGALRIRCDFNAPAPARTSGHTRRPHSHARSTVTSRAQATTMTGFAVSGSLPPATCAGLQRKTSRGPIYTVYVGTPRTRTIHFRCFDRTLHTYMYRDQSEFYRTYGYTYRTRRGNGNARGARNG